MLVVDRGGERRDACLGATAFDEHPLHGHHGENGDRKRKSRYERDQPHHGFGAHRSENSTSTSTMTSTAAPRRRAGLNRQFRTALIARSSRPEPRPRSTLTSPTLPSDLITISSRTSPVIRLFLASSVYCALTSRSNLGGSMPPPGLYGPPPAPPPVPSSVPAPRSGPGAVRFWRLRLLVAGHQRHRRDQCP